MFLCLLTSEPTFLHMESKGNNSVIASLPYVICFEKDHHTSGHYIPTVWHCLFIDTYGLWVHECETLICTFSVIIFLYEHLFPGFFPLKCNIFHVFSKYQPLVLTQCLLHNRCLPSICSMINLINKWLNPRKKETYLETALNRSKPVVLSYWCLCPQRTYSSVWRQLLLGDGEGGHYY